jgi:predicted CoA-substrate-specific enzyme activase
VVVDVGGQDTKVIEVNAGGEVTDFLMNDKCAAGTGRFLEMMAGVLETDLEGLSRLALAARAPVTINSTCSVFAESEVVSLIAHAVPKADIAAGLFRAIAERIGAMLRHFGRPERLVFCGGGALSSALRAAIEQTVGQALIVPDNPQFTVAFGAVLAGQPG